MGEGLSSNTFPPHLSLSSQPHPQRGSGLSVRPSVHLRTHHPSLFPGFLAQPPASRPATLTSPALPQPPGSENSRFLQQALSSSPNLPSPTPASAQELPDHSARGLPICHEHKRGRKPCQPYLIRASRLPLWTHFTNQRDIKVPRGKGPSWSCVGHRGRQCLHPAMPAHKSQTLLLHECLLTYMSRAATSRKPPRVLAPLCAVDCTPSAAHADIQ